MSFLVLPQHEQFYPEGLSYYVLENLGWIKLAPKFKDFPATTAISRTFKALNFLFQISRTFNRKFKDSSRTFKDTFPIFSVKKGLESMSFLVLPQHE